ncbi:type VII secretion protein EssC, partial [Listeria innocua]|nr:type VII secretion protein EssC [Listeria innocua]
CLNEIKTRKKLLSQYRVANIEQYERASGKELPNIIIVLDNYDAVKDAGLGDDFEKIITQITREGASIGMFMIISASRHMSLRTQMTTNIKQMIALYLIDKNDISSTVGRTDTPLEEYPGRALVKLETVTTFQTTLPSQGEETIQQIEGIRNEAKLMREGWQGELPESVPMIPEKIKLADFCEWMETKE